MKYSLVVISSDNIAKLLITLFLIFCYLMKWLSNIFQRVFELLFNSDCFTAILMLLRLKKYSSHFTFLCIWQALYSKATKITFKVHILLIWGHALSGNQTHDLVVASAMLYSLSYRRTVNEGCWEDEQAS